MPSLADELTASLKTMTPAMKRDAQSMADVQSRVALAGVGRSFVSADSKPGTGVATVVDKAMAIQDIFEMQERTGVRFIILGDLAKAIRENRSVYDGDKIEFGFHVS